MNTPIIYEAYAPSNIAFLKYWGKADEDLQWPANDSLSMSLSQLGTKTTAQRISASDHEVEFNDQSISRDHDHGKKIYKHLDFLGARFKLTTKLGIKTSNSFPTGCGIASSASGLAALTIASLAAWFDAPSFHALEEHKFFKKDIADLSRMGSGSAGRSLWGGFVLWEKSTSALLQKISQSFNHTHWDLCDSVALFSKEAKKVSSTEGHRLAWTSPLFPPRQAIIHERLQSLIDAIKHREMNKLGPIIEQEALEMHAVMMSAETPVYYFGHETSQFLAWIRQIRNTNHLPVYFTLDAGSNVHLIYEKKYKTKLIPLLEERMGKDSVLHDEVGIGPTLKTV